MRLVAFSLLIGSCAGLAPKVFDRQGFFQAVTASAAVVATPALGAQTVDPSSIKTTLGGVKYVVSKEGTCPAADPTGLAGSCIPKQGSFCVIDYTGFLPDGTVFDTTERKGGKPLAFKLGEKQVIVGLEQLVSQMKPGEEVNALVPAELAYGSKGVCTDDGECLIKPDSNLKYFVRLIRTAASAG